MDASIGALLPWKTMAVGLWLAALFLAERLRPAAPEPAGGREAPGGPWRLIRNGALWCCTIGLSAVFVVPVSLLATQHTLGWRPEWWGGWPGLALDIVVLDALIYWWHRANHVVPFLWRFHEVHHLDRFLDTTTALRFHFGEVALSTLARAGIIIVLAIPFTSVVVFETLILIGTIFHHSNLALPPQLERALSRVVITPSIHWVHHHAVRRDTDSNYGTLFSFWDPLFGTRSPTPRTPEMAIGVERRGERGLTHLLVRPLLSERRRLEPARQA